MAYRKGEVVWILSMRVSGTILEHRNGRYVLSVEKFTVECPESDLSAKKPKKAGKVRKIAPRHHPALKPVGNQRALEKIDLHGMTVEEAIRAVEKRVNDAIIADLHRLEVVHGVGTGALLKAVHQYLSRLSVIAEYKLDSLNPGVTWVYFDS